MNVFLGHNMNIFLGFIGVQEFFSFNFPLREYFFVLRPPPPHPHTFSNDLSLIKYYFYDYDDDDDDDDYYYYYP